MQTCARCGFVVYPAEKINCIDQNWHKACFHCDICKMVLTANNFVSHNKRPYCSVHNPRNNTFTSVYEAPVNINVKKSQASMEVKYRQVYEQEVNGKVSTEAASEKFIQYTNTEESEQQRGKGSFPAMITPGYYLAKKAQENLSGVGYKRDLGNAKGHSINFCETPQFQNSTKVAKFTSDNKYREKYTSEMKERHEDSVIDKRTMHAMKAVKLASDISYKKGQEQDQEYTYQATLTPGYQSQKKLDPLKEKNYRQHINQMRYRTVTDTPEILLAKKNAQLMSKLNYTADYESSKHQYTLSQDLPQIRNAKANANLISDIKYKEDWEKTKSKACDIGVHDLSVKAAKASRDLASDIKYKESYMKNKETATTMNVSDSKTLHSLQAAKICSNINYKKGSKEGQSQFSLPKDMIHLSHAKKAQALASDLEYRTKLHEYTVMPDDMKLQHAKKASSLQSENQYRSDLNWMKGVGWETEGCLNVTQVKKAGELLSDNKYRQKADSIKFTQVADNLSINHAKKCQELQSDLAYKAKQEQMIHQYTISHEDSQFKQAKANAVFSEVKYKEQFEKDKGKAIGIKSVWDDSQMAHSAKATKLQSDLNYKKEYEDNKTKFGASMDMLNMSHAKKAQDLATETNYRTILHEYTTLPTDMNITWAKKAYGLQSDKQYRSDLHWMKGVGWEASESLDMQQAKKAGELLSEKYREGVSAESYKCEGRFRDGFGPIYKKRLYREKSENQRHRYTLSDKLPELVQAKKNAKNISESRYKESWTKVRDGGYKLSLDAIPFQSAKASAEILSDQKYKEGFEKNKGKMIGLKTLQDDINILHTVQANKLQSDIKYKKNSAMERSKYHLPMDMMEVAHAKKAQSLVSDQDYRLTLHQYTSLPNDMKVQAARRAYDLQSDKVYRADLNYLRGVPWIGTGALQIEGSKKATELISDKKYRQLPSQFKHTSVTDSPDIVHARLSGQLTNERLYKEKGISDQHNYTITSERPEITQAKINAANLSEVKYKESWHTLRAKGYKLSAQDIPFQSAKSSTGIASDYNYKFNHLLEKGRHIGSKSVMDDPHLLHCQRAGRLASEQEYRKDALFSSGKYHLGNDMINLVTAKNAQALASTQDYGSKLHTYTVLPDDMKVQWAKKAYDLQSEKLYKSDLSYMKGVAWDGVGAPQMETAKKAGELISDNKYRQLPESLKFTSVTDSPDMVHAKSSYLQCSERLYKSQRNDDMNKYTLHGDDPDFIRAKTNAQQISDKMYKASGEQVKQSGYDLRLDAIPFQTAKASREIASDNKYRQLPESLKFTSVTDSPDMVHAKSSYLQCSERLYKSQRNDDMNKYTLHGDDPDFIRAKTNAQQISDKVYKASGEQVKQSGYDLRLDAIPFQTAKASREIASDVQYKESYLKDRGQQVGLRSVEDDPKIMHSLGASKLQSNLEYKRKSKEERSKYNMQPDQPEFIQARKSQAQASDLVYRNKLHDYTCDPEQLNLKHAKQAYKLQSDVNYKSDLNWIRGVGWTPPGSHKAEMARRAAELGLAEGVSTDEAIEAYQSLMAQQQMEQQEVKTREEIQQGINMDAMEVLHVQRKKTIQTVQKKTTTSFKSMEKKSSSSLSSAHQEMKEIDVE